MDQQKKKALIEWVNSVGVGPCIESLSQLKDGSILCKLVHLIDPDIDIVDESSEEDKLGITASFLEERFKCSLSDKINIDTVISGHEFESAKLCLLVMGASLMSGNNDLFVERAQKLEPILQFEIKEMVEWLLPLHEHNTADSGLNCSFFQVLSRSLHLTEEQMAHPQMSSTPHCTPGAVNNDINTPPNNFNTTPGRVFKGTPLMFSNSIQNANNSILGRFMSPKHVGGTPLIPMSPIQQLVHSPGMASKIMMQQKEMQIRRLQRELNAEKHMKMDMESEISEQKRSLEKKEQQISSLQKQLNKYRRQTLTLQEDVDRMEGVAEKNQNLEQEILRKKCIMTENRELKDRFSHLEKDNGQLYSEVERLQNQLGQLRRYRANSEDLQMTFEDLKVSYSDLMQINSDKESQLGKLREENEVLRMDLLKIKEDYHTKCEELRMKKEPSLSDIGENMGEVMETRYQEEMEQLQNEFENQVYQVKNLQEQLQSIQARNESLSNDLAAAKTQCDQLSFDVESYSQKNQELDCELKKKIEEFAVGEQQYDNLQTHCKKVEEELMAAQQHGTDLDVQLSNTKQDCCRLAQSLKNEKDQTGLFEGKIQKLERIRDKLNTEIEQRQSEKSEMSHQIEILQEEKTKLNDLLVASKSECENKQGDMLKWEQAWKEVCEKLENNNNILEEKLSQLDSVEKRYKALEKSTETLKTEFTEKDSHCNMWQNMARGFETQVKELEQKIKVSGEISEQKQKNLENELENSKDIVRQLQASIEKSKSDTVEREQKISGNMESARGRINELEGTIKSWEEKCCELENELKNSKDIVRQLQASIEKSKSDTVEREQKISGNMESARGRINELEGTIKSWEEKCCEQENVLQQQEQSYLNLKQEVHRLDAENKKYEQQINEGNAVVNNLKLSVQKYEISLTDRNELVAARDTEIIELKSLFQEKQSQYDSLCKQVESITKSHTKLEASLNDEIKSTTSELDAIKGELGVETEKCHILQDTIGEKDAKLREIEQDVYIWQDKYAQLDGTHFSLQQQVKKMDEDFTNTKNEKIRIQKDIEVLQREISSYVEQIKKLEMTVAESEEKRQKLEKANKMLHDEKYALNSEGKSLETFINTIKQENEKLESEIEKMKKDHCEVLEKFSVNKSNTEIELQKEIESYRVALEGMKSELSEKLKEQEQMQISNQNKNDRIAVLEKQSEMLEGKVKEEQLEREAACNENENFSEQLKQLNEAVNQKADEIENLKKHIESITNEKKNLSEKLVEAEKSAVIEQEKRECSHAAVLNAESASGKMKVQFENVQAELERQLATAGKEKANFLDRIKSLEMSIIQGQQALHETEEQCRQDIDMYEKQYNVSEQKVAEQQQAIIHLNEELSNAQRELKDKEAKFNKKFQSLEEEDIKLQSFCSAVEGDLTRSEILNGELRAQIESLQASQVQLKYDCESVKAEKMCTEHSMKSWQQKARDYEMKHAEAEEQVYLSKEATDNKTTELKNEIKQVRERNEQLQSIVDSITNKMSLVETELKKKQHSFESDQQFIANLQSQLNEMQTNNKNLLDETSMYKQKIQTAELKQNSLKKELDTYKEKMTVTENHVESYFQKVCLLDEALKNKNSEKDKYQKQVSELKLSLDNATNRIENMEEQMRREQQKYSNLENEYSDAESVNACLEEKIQELESKMLQVESALNTTQVEKTNVEESFKVELTSAQSKQQQLERDLEEAHSVVEEFRKELVGLQGQLQNMDSDLLGSRKRNKDLNDQLVSIEKENVSLKKDLISETKRSETLEQELEKWNTKWTDVETYVGSQQDRACNMEDKLAMSRKEVENLEKKLSDSEIRSANLEEELKLTKLKVEEVKDNTLIEVKEARKAETDAEAALEDVQTKYGHLEEQYNVIQKKYSDAKQYVGKLHERYQNAEKESSKDKNSFEDLQKKYLMLKAAAQKHKDRVNEVEKRESQYNDVLNKYKAQQEVKNAEIAKLNKKLTQEIENKENWEQKCQELDVEITALRQQNREEDAIHKKQNSEIRSLEAQLAYANRELRGSRDIFNMPRKVLSARELPTTAHLVMKKDSTSESELDRSVEVTYGLRSGRTPRLSGTRKHPRSPSLPNLRKAPSSFSLASSIKSDYPNEDHLLSPTGSTHSQDSLDSNSVFRRSRRLTEFGRTGPTLSGFDPIRSADVPRGFGALISSEDEPEQLEFEFGRLSELQRRNTLCLPHMKSSYPVETQVRPPKEMKDDLIRQGSTLEQAMDELEEGTVEKRKQRKRMSEDRHSFNGHDGAAKKKFKEDKEENDEVYKLNTPGVKLYKRYSPRLARKSTPSSRRFETARLHAALEEAAAVSPVAHARKATPKKTPSSLRKLRSWTKSTTKELSNDENDRAKTRSLRESMSFSIGFTPVKNSKSKLRGLMSGKKDSQIKKKPLGDNNHVKSGI